MGPGVDQDGGDAMSAKDDLLTKSLDRTANVAEDGAREQQRAAAVARRAAQDRRSKHAGGATTAESIRSVLDLLGRSSEHLAAAVADLRRVWARTLADEGLSLRNIGQRLGVSHQRVSILLTRHRDSANRRDHA